MLTHCVHNIVFGSENFACSLLQIHIAAGYTIGKWACPALVNIMSYEDIESSMENVRSKVDAINLGRWRDFLSAQCHAHTRLER